MCGVRFMICWLAARGAQRNPNGITGPLLLTWDLGISDLHAWLVCPSMTDSSGPELHAPFVSRRQEDEVIVAPVPPASRLSEQAIVSPGLLFTGIYDSG